MTKARFSSARWLHFIARIAHYYHRGGLSSVLRRAFAIFLAASMSNRLGYVLWWFIYQRPTRRDLAAMRRHLEKFAYQPQFSIIPLGDGRSDELSKKIAKSIMRQTYPHWELCSAATVDGAMSKVKGDYILFLQKGTLLASHALYMIAAELNRDRGADVLYTDEDEIAPRRFLRSPYFKPDWDLDLFLGWDYLGGSYIVRRASVEAFGGVASVSGANPCYDLLLRLLDHQPAPKICHIPWILLHRSAGLASAKGGPGDAAAARQAVIDHCARNHLGVQVQSIPGREWQRRLIYPLPDVLPLTSIIIPTRDRVDLLRQCVEGLLHRTNYPRMEIIVVDNGSEGADTFAYLREIAGQGVRILREEGPFNYAALNNAAVGQATGEVIVLLNNDTKVIHPDWLNEMVCQALRPSVGAVGAKLYFPSGSIQHAGVVVGLGGIAGHLHLSSPGDSPGDHDDLLLVRQTSAVTAACLALRKEVFIAVGGFDAERLPVAFNDVDLCLRIRGRGLRIIWTPFAELYHFESASRGSDLTPDKIERSQREYRAMQNLWEENLIVDPFYNPNRTLLIGYDGGFAFPPRVSKPWQRFLNRSD